MPRQLKPTPVGDPIFDRNTGDQIQIYLNRNTQYFFFEFQGEKVESKVFDELPGKARKVLLDANDLEWYSAIYVTYKKRGSWNSEPREPIAGISFERFQWAHRKDGKLMKRDLYWYDENSISSKKGWSYGQPTYWRWRGGGGESLAFETPAYFEGGAYLPYSDELWQGLNQMRAAIEMLETRIKEIVTTPEGSQMIELVGKGTFNLLAAPEAGDE